MKIPKNPNEGRTYDKGKLSSIVLAGGCFWGTQAFLRRIPGVAETVCGYANGHTENPSYKEVCGQRTGYAEAVMVRYDPSVVSLGHLLQKFFRTINPTSRYKQGGDIGTQYRTGIYYQNERDKAIINNFIEGQRDLYANPIVTEVEPLKSFWEAEDYHQDYLEKNPDGYCHVDMSMLEDQ